MKLRLIALLLLAACNPDDPGDSTVVTAVPAVRITPSVGGRGMTMELEVRGLNTRWQPGDLTVALGDAIAVESVEVQAEGLAVATVTIGAQAPLGYHDMRLSFPQRVGDESIATELTLDGTDGFLVEPGGILSVEPHLARLGETLTVQVEGFNTNFQEGVTWLDLGAGVFVNSVSVQDATHATASISVDQRAEPGWHDLVAFNGPTGYTKPDALFIDRSAVAVAISPAFGYQGEVIPGVSILGQNTHFDDSGTRATLVDLGPHLCVNEFWPECQDLVEPGGEAQVFGPEAASVEIRISNGTPIGFYDLRVYTVERQDFDGNGLFDPGEFVVLEEVVLHDAFEVRETRIDCDANPGVSFSFNVGRGVDNDTCQVSEVVTASAVFFTPLDPPCGSAPPGSPPVFYDLPNYYVTPPSTDDCPPVPTCDAGPVVYLESDVNTIELVRQTNSISGDFWYVPGRALTLADYAFGHHAYTLWSDGSDIPGQIPAFRAEDVLWTIPSDFELLEPQLCDNFTHDPNESLPVSWTAAQTYDVASLSMSWATADQDGVGYQLLTFPWDDGAHVWPSDELLGVPEGAGQFGFAAGAAQPKWFFDFGDGPVGVENQGRSGLGYSGFMILRSGE